MLRTVCPPPPAACLFFVGALATIAGAPVSEPAVAPRAAAALLLLLVAVSAAIWLRVVQFRHRARKLEATVVQRTVEVRQERERLAAANQRLADANEQLTAAKAAVEASHVHLLAMLDQLGIGVLVIDLQERVLFPSRATTGLLAGMEEAAVGRSLEDVLPIAPATLAEIRNVLLAPPHGVRIPAKLEPRAGQRYWTDIDVRVDPRDATHRVLYLYDVTEAYDLDRRKDRKGAGATLIGASPAMRRLHAQIQTAAAVDTTVLIEGETGTGKELVARAIHDASRRRGRPFVAINCGGLTESLFASQLFGHARGAFTGAVADHVGLFEAAHSGTLLLDEVGDMPLGMQTHLLRVLQEREIVRVGESRARRIDVRVIAATHRSLEREVADGRFRDDLLYRIRVARIELRPLRERTEDIPALADTFVSQFSAAHGKAIEAIGLEAMDHLIVHAWPGNVRELKSTIEWAVIHATGPAIKLADLPRELVGAGTPPPRAPMPEADRQVYLSALRRAAGNRSKAARLLGVSRATFYRRLAALEGDVAAETPPDPSESTGDPS